MNMPFTESSKGDILLYLDENTKYKLGTWISNKKGMIKSAFIEIINTSKVIVATVFTNTLTEVTAMGLEQDSQP